MILSRTSQYAIQALIYVTTRPRGEPVLNREIAEHLGVPAAYLAKIMQTLCRSHLLDSFRGRLGGFCLHENAEKTDLMQILLLTEGAGFTDTCLLGLKVCSDETACPMHSRWKPIKEKVVLLLKEQTLEKLALAVQSGKYRITDLPHAAMNPP
ncbi:MAG: Rrf2 family transcriptional regulator [Sulfuricella sp.]|jgi:Rrf2 family protein|nr:Rrf2 family transcriptional regulator [Sulfuricella sp.]